MVPAERLTEYTDKVISDFKRYKGAGESFVEYADRVGHERFAPEAVLAADTKAGLGAVDAGPGAVDG